MRVLEDLDEYEKLLKDFADKLVVIDFHASWCGPCKMIGPKFEKMEEDFPEVIFAKCDVDENEEAAEEWDISAMPTFIFYRDEKKIGEVTGSDKDKLRGAIEKLNEDPEATMM